MALLVVSGASVLAVKIWADSDRFALEKVRNGYAHLLLDRQTGSTWWIYRGEIKRTRAWAQSPPRWASQGNPSPRGHRASSGATAADHRALLNFLTDPNYNPGRDYMEGVLSRVFSAPRPDRRAPDLAERVSPPGTAPRTPYELTAEDHLAIANAMASPDYDPDFDYMAEVRRRYPPPEPAEEPILSSEGQDSD